jgi:TonB family protein
MKDNLLLLIFLLSLMLITTQESFGLSEKQKIVLAVNKLGYSQLEYESAYKDIAYDVNYVYTDFIQNSFNDRGLIQVKYLPVILNFRNPDTHQIQDLCHNYDLDVYLVTRIQFGTENRKGSASIPKTANSGEVFISMKLYSRDGSFIDSAFYNSPKVLKNDDRSSQENVLEKSIDAIVAKIIKQLSLQSNGFNISKVTQQTWQSYKILLKNGSYQEIKQPARINLCLYNNGGYYLESIPDSTKKLPGDKYDYNPAEQKVILHSKGDDFEFTVIGLDDNLLVLRPKNIENINKIYFKRLSVQEIAEILKPQNDSIRSFSVSYDSLSGKSTRHEHIEVFDEPIFFVVEEPATFQGGNLDNFRTFVLKNTNYPSEAQEKRMSGKVVVQFVIGTDGSIKFIIIIRSSGWELLDNEAIRVISSSPKWTPGRQGGKAINQLFTMPVSFIAQ